MRTREREFYSVTEFTKRLWPTLVVWLCHFCCFWGDCRLVEEQRQQQRQAGFCGLPPFPDQHPIVVDRAKTEADKGEGLRSGEMAGGAFDSVACAVGSLGIDCVVVGGGGVEAFYAYSEDGGGVILIESDVGFCGLS
jgi:hypothetical protein